MPQHHRGIAFSNKKKKERLKAKRVNKKTFSWERRNMVRSTVNQNVGSLNVENDQGLFFHEVEEINKSKHSRYNLKFKKESQSKVSSHYEAVVMQPVEELEKDQHSFYPLHLDYPCRPSWKPNTSKAQLDQNENKYFRLFCERMDKNFQDGDLNLYELNLETWRQLWRVTEMSDILLIIVDARFPVAHFPPYLYKHLIEKENKGVIVIFNKCDLVPPSLVLAWQDYFMENFPKVLLVPFSSLEGKEVKKTNFKMAAEGAFRLIEACEKLVEKNVDLTSWRVKVEEERIDTFDGDGKCQIGVVTEHQLDDIYPRHSTLFQDGILTLGTIGFPNVGKSSLINALMGKKVVSVSKTPGHTKYFQTIFITKNVKLCDCPGLVFPSLCPRQLQVLFGSYPIAQVRDPVSSIAYIAARIDMPSILRLHQFQDTSEEDFQWTPFYICEAWAKKRGYFIRTKGGRPDVYRAANELLRFTLVGYKSLILTLRPPEYSKRKEKYEEDPRQREVRIIQGVHADPDPLAAVKIQQSEDSDESEGSDPEEEETREEKEDSDDSEDSTVATCANKFALLDD